MDSGLWQQSRSRFRLQLLSTSFLQASLKRYTSKMQLFSVRNPGLHLLHAKRNKFQKGIVGFGSAAELERVSELRKHSNWRSSRSLHMSIGGKTTDQDSRAAFGDAQFSEPDPPMKEE